MDFPPGCVFLDGRFSGMEDAKISVLDWGFLRSDATYDVAHVWKGRFFRLDRHIQRIEECAPILSPDIVFFVTLSPSELAQNHS